MMEIRSHLATLTWCQKDDDEIRQSDQRVDHGAPKPVQHDRQHVGLDVCISGRNHPRDGVNNGQVAHFRR